MKPFTNYHPQYFLASLGSGGIAVTFFMYLNFLTKHSGPIATFDSLIHYFSAGNISYMLMICISFI